MGDDGGFGGFGGFGEGVSANENDNGAGSSGLGGYGDDGGLGAMSGFDSSMSFDSGLGFDSFSDDGSSFGFGLTGDPSVDGTVGISSFNSETQDDDGVLGKFGKQALSMALNMALGKMGVPSIGINMGNTAMNAMNAPTQQGQQNAIGLGVMNGITSMMGIPMGMVNTGLNAMSQAGMIGQPNTNADGSPAPAGTTGASSASTGGMGGGVEGLLGGLASLYGYNRANSAANDQVNSLSGMYGQDSPYAQMLRQQLVRKDAAAGRRSQYGNREVELQARLAQLASGNANSIANIRGGQNQMRAQGLAQLINFMNKSGATQGIQNGLQGMFNQGSGQQFDSSYGPALDPYGAGSGWGQDTLSSMGAGSEYFGG